MPGDFGNLLHHLPAWLLVLFRLTGLFVMAPLLGSSTIPRQVKVFAVVGLSFCVYPMLLDPARPSAGFVGQVVDQGLSLWSVLGNVVVELLIGFVVGFGASLPIVAMQIGGQVIGQQMGVAFAQVVNPEFNEHSGIVGQFFFMMALAIFVILGGHRVMFATLIGSFDHVPLGGFTGFDSVVRLTLGILAVSYELALRVAAPLLCLIFLQTTAMGFIARSVPQLNILSVGFILRIVNGTAFLVISISVVAGVYVDTLREVLRELFNLFAT